MKFREKYLLENYLLERALQKKEYKWMLCFLMLEIGK